jgi:DNA-binding transcriptional LysR family regulator
MQYLWNWDHVRIFLALHRGGTLAAASRALRQDPTTVGRRISALEEATGGGLFVRTGGGWQLSDLGHAALPQAEAMETAALALARSVAGRQTSLSGTLRLACVSSFAEEVLIPKLSAFLGEHPGVDLELVTSASLADLARREADVAVRFTSVGQGPSTVGGSDVLNARRVGVLTAGLFASTAYLAANPTPATVADLANHRMIGKDERGADVPGYRWLLELERAHSPSIAMRCNPHPTTRAAAESGLGIGLLPLFIAARRPTLVRVLPEVDVSPRAIWLVVHRDLAKVARVMALMRFLGSVRVAQE